MNFGRGADDASGTNAVLIKEGTKTYSADQQFKMVEAYANAALSPEEKAVFESRCGLRFHKEATALAHKIDGPKPKRSLRPSRPGRRTAIPICSICWQSCYLEGKGTDKDEQLGLEVDEQSSPKAGLETRERTWRG